MGKRSEFYHRVALMILQEEASSIDDATQMLNKDICQEESKYWLKLSKKLIWRKKQSSTSCSSLGLLSKAQWRASL